MRRRISRAQQTKNWCVGFSFPPPAYAGIHPTLYLFGFRADALNSHSPPYLPGFDPRSCLERFDTFSGSSGKVVGFSCRGLRSSETVRGPPGPLWCPRFRGALLGFGAPLRPLEGCRGFLRAPPGCLRAPPGASGRLRGASGGLGAFFWVWTGFGSGFRVFWPPSTTPCLADPKFQHFPGHLLETAGQWAPRATPRKPPRPRSLGLGFLNESQKRRRGPLGGAPAPAPGGAAHALNHSLGLHSTSKQWCESLPDVVLGPGTLEKGGYGLSRPGWEFRV